MKSLGLGSPASVKPGEDLAVSLGLKTAGESPEQALVRLAVFGAKGRPCRYFHRFVWLKDGTARVKLPLAFDEPPGVYRVVATHVLSGTRGVRSLTCGPTRSSAGPP